MRYQQTRVTGALTLAFTGLQAFGMLTVFTWIGLEQSIVVQTGGRYWPEELGRKHWTRLNSWLGLRGDPDAENHEVGVSERRSTQYGRLKNVLSRFGIGSSKEAASPVLPVISLEHVSKAEPNAVSPPAGPSEQNPVGLSSRPPIKHAAEAEVASIGSIHPRRQLLEILRGIRLHGLRRELERVEVKHSLVTRAEPILDVRFSPLGGDFAIASQDASVAIFHNSSQDVATAGPISHHIQGDIEDFTWSPVAGGGYLVRLATVIEQWSSDGGYVKTFHRRRRTCAVVWFQDGQSFLLAEIRRGSSYLVQMTVRDGLVIKSWTIDKLTVRDFSLCSDGKRVVIVAEALNSGNGLRLSRSRTERRIFVYNLIDSKIETQAPMFDDVHRVILARNGKSVLTSFENKAQPQLWDLGFSERDPDRAQLSLMMCYGSPSNHYSGIARFGGSDDQYVICPTEDGAVNVWDRDSGTLLHCFRTDIHITSIAADPVSPTLRIVSASRGGAVKIIM